MPLKPTDRGLFVEMLAALAAVYGRELSAGVIEIYFNALRPYDIAAVRRAFDLHVKNPDAGQFMPKPADLIRMIEGGTQDSALQAWTKVEKAIRMVGGYADVAFDDPLIHRCIDDMGGWIRMCETTEDELPFTAKEFQNRYRGYAMRHEIPAYPSVLIGRENAENGRMGHPLSPPRLVGDREAAALVLGSKPKQELIESVVKVMP